MLLVYKFLVFNTTPFGFAINKIRNLDLTIVIFMQLPFILIFYNLILLMLIVIEFKISILYSNVKEKNLYKRYLVLNHDCIYSYQ